MRRRIVVVGTGAVAAGLMALAAFAAAPSQPLSQIEIGAVLAQRGDWDHDIPACRDCHGARGEGVGSAFPPLAGRPAKDIAPKIEAWKAGTRDPGPQGLMKAIAQRLTAEQVAAVTAYYEAGGTALAPKDERLPDDAFGKIVRRGAAIFSETPDQAAGFIGNQLTCAHCHVDAGRRANSAPLGPAYVIYPMFRKKEGKVLTYAERLQGCFRYSMNGRPPPLGDEVLVALEAYSYFLAKGAPVGKTLPGQGYPIPPKPAQGMDFKRGAAVFADKCALCHGKDGQGQSAGGRVVFPALWGPGSFNWGAGMGRIDKAAGFIKANMPYSRGNTLTDQEAWDVAFFIDGHERPQDPRFTGDVGETRRTFHDTPMSSYGTTVDGVLLGARSVPSGPAPATR